MSPETILPILQWVAIISVSGAIVGGFVCACIDYRKGIKAHNDRYRASLKKLQHPAKQERRE